MTKISPAIQVNSHQYTSAFSKDLGRLKELVKRIIDYIYVFLRNIYSFIFFKNNIPFSIDNPLTDAQKRKVTKEKSATRYDNYDITKEENNTLGSKESLESAEPENKNGSLNGMIAFVFLAAASVFAFKKGVSLVKGISNMSFLKTPGVTNGQFGSDLTVSSKFVNSSNSLDMCLEPERVDFQSNDGSLNANPFWQQGITIIDSPIGIPAASKTSIFAHNSIFKMLSMRHVGIYTFKKAGSLIWRNLTTTVVSGVVIYLLYKLKNKRQQKKFLEKKLSGEETVQLEKQKLALEQEIHQMKQERDASLATPLSEELGFKAKQKMDLFRKIECYINFLNLVFENKLIRVIWNENAAFHLMSHHLFEENKNITEIREILNRTEELFHSEVKRLLGIDSYELIKRISQLEDISLIKKRDLEDLKKIQKRSDILDKITEPLGRIKDLLHVEIKNQLTVNINEICLLPALAPDDDSDVKAIKDKLEEVKKALNRSALSPDLLFDNDVIKQLRKQLMYFTMEMKKLDKLPDLSLDISESRQIKQLLSQIGRSINQLRKL